ncbi:hypothetical protein HGI47_20120 [Novosphingobium sp. ERN07]|uniref:hypothetical protein n=1 Tax=Novosphingobium sp. ERN07 TaxID=2726187 RepID=UPI001457332D|nr:hypothetical protein [Novosphingobium sp. ERN07]NLR73180.1 hypothetical protein [Novosphingobium sp. ERN07]
MLVRNSHEVLEQQDCRSIVAAARTQLAEIINALTIHFDAASLALGDAVTTIDQVVTALREIAGVFDVGEAASAVDDLMGAAEALLTVKDQADTRACAIVEIRDSSLTLRSCVGEILRCIQVLEIYGMNVKITASGAAEFTEFADRMRGKLNAAGGEVRSLDETLEQLEISLCEMSRDDALLVNECAKVVPQVPDRLMRDAEALKKHQGGLVRLAQSTNTVAMAIRSELGLALGTIQIGDRVRQRLEHVMLGCHIIEDAATSGGEDKAFVDLTQQHILPLLGALTTAAAAEFSQDARSLLASLHRLKDTSGQLNALQEPGRSEKGQGFLALLESGIAEAEGMIIQLSQADRQGSATLEHILTTVDDVAAKMAAITELRLEVRNMAINIGLSCRNIGQFGKPIMIVANEIRTYVERLDQIVSRISKAEAALLETSSQMDSKRAKAINLADQISHFLEVIRLCDDRTVTALNAVEEESANVHSSLNIAIKNLEKILNESLHFDVISSKFKIDFSYELEMIDNFVPKLQSIFDLISRNYTMNDERDVHNSCIPEYIQKIITGKVEISKDRSEEDDDGLF